MNEELEILSDKVRDGIPVSFDDAFRVIEYQETKNQKKKPSLLNKIQSLFKRKSLTPKEQEWPHE